VVQQGRGPPVVREQKKRKKGFSFDRSLKHLIDLSTPKSPNVNRAATKNLPKPFIRTSLREREYKGGAK